MNAAVATAADSLSDLNRCCTFRPKPCVVSSLPVDGGESSGLFVASVVRGESWNRERFRLVPPGVVLLSPIASSSSKCRLCCALRDTAPAAAGDSVFTTVRTASPVTRPAMSPNADCKKEKGQSSRDLCE